MTTRIHVDIDNNNNNSNHANVRRYSEISSLALTVYWYVHQTTINLTQLRWR